MTAPRDYSGEALRKAGLAPTQDEVIAELAILKPLEAAKRLKEDAKKLGINVGDLRKAVADQRKQSQNNDDALPHWKVEPWPDDVPGAELLDGIKATFEKYIVLPAGAGDALALWVVHAWTMDAGDISPFLVLVSPTNRCGKTSVLIVLLYLTPRSELASNISASALFRYIEDVRPTLLIDEADSFLKENEEMRGILNSGHTKAAAHVIRNVETNGEYKPRRFSTWAPKAIATIRALADTLEDRAIALQLQRKATTAKVARLRKRDAEEFAALRQKAARWAADNFPKLTDPEPRIPDILNDRAADNWRPLLAIAVLAGADWSRRARDAACILSGEGHEASSSNVELLADIRRAFGDDDAIRSVDLVAKLVADPERPWVEWRHGKPLTPKQLGGLLSAFSITSETVRPAGFPEGAKGYQRGRFEELWGVYLPGQTAHNTLAEQIPPAEASIRPNADGTGTSRISSKRPEGLADGSKNDDLSHGRSGLDAWTAKQPPKGAKGNLTTSERVSTASVDPTAKAPSPAPEPTSAATKTNPAPQLSKVVTVKTEPADDIPPFLRRCIQCGNPSDANGAVTAHKIGDALLWLHEQCHRFRLRNPHADFHPSVRQPAITAEQR
jgi:putative DNA primase/helicase